MSSGDQRGPKYISKKMMGPPAHAGRVINVKTETNVQDVINSALGIIKQQVDTLNAKSRMGGSLMDVDVKNLRTYIQSLVELSREERERAKHDGIEQWVAELSTEELVKMAQGNLAQSALLDGAIDVPGSSEDTED